MELRAIGSSFFYDLVSVPLVTRFIIECVYSVCQHFPSAAFHQELRGILHEEVHHQKTGLDPTHVLKTTLSPLLVCIP